MTSPTGHTAEGQGAASQQCPAVCRSGSSQFTAGTRRDEMQLGIWMQHASGKRKTMGSSLGMDCACMCLHPTVHPSGETEQAQMHVVNLHHTWLALHSAPGHFNVS